MELIMASGSNALIHLPVQVTFAEGSNFRKQLMAAIEEKVSHLTIDLSDTEFMDSAGLGMLLVALKVLRRPKGAVKKLLELTRSNERFHITY
jgi:anti-anti-sigma factor